MAAKWLDTFITDRITIMVVPRANRGIRSYRIPVGVIYGVFLVFFVTLFTSGSAVMRAGELSRQKEEVARLNRENTHLQGELTMVRGRMEEAATSLAKLLRFEEEIRIVADLEEIDPDTREVGIGGPVISGPADVIEWNRPAEGTFRELEDTRKDVETLARQARLLDESFHDVYRVLSEKKDQLARTPSILPVENSWITDRFGYRKDPFTGKRRMHYGLDISARRGEPIVATADGVVKSAGRKGNFGLEVEIDHGDGMMTRYGHANQLFVKRGQKVVRGQVIATVGMSGRATAPHLHYEVRIDDRCVNPLDYILTADLHRRS